MSEKGHHTFAGRNLKFISTNVRAALDVSVYDKAALKRTWQNTSLMIRATKAVSLQLSAEQRRRNTSFQSSETIKLRVEQTINLEEFAHRQ